MSDEQPRPVGFKSLPVKHRWQSGQSGNPKGIRKRRKPVSVAETLARVLAERVIVQIGTDRCWRTNLEVILEQLQRASVTNLRALAHLLAFEKDFAEHGDMRPIEIRIDPRDVGV